MVNGIAVLLPGGGLALIGDPAAVPIGSRAIDTTSVVDEEFARAGSAPLSRVVIFFAG